MKTAVEVRDNHHTLFLSYRAQNRIIHSEAFAEAWDLFDKEDKACVYRLFKNPDPVMLKRLLLRKLFGGLSQYPVKILRQIASYHQIINYGLMGRDELLEALDKKGVTYGSQNFERDDSGSTGGDASISDYRRRAESTDPDSI